ncbi:MAG: 4'-phosphopantetheinyl transferase superfamily protein [Clostridia bacterium]|nr:4'-phosphopantetheinyl transferase superfamily protein [Clostridia bacterium]
MYIYYYNKVKGHTRKNTDELIKKSCIHRFGKTYEILRNEYGKPYLKDSDAYISVTHTDSTVLIAIWDAEFGIDCEKKDRLIKNSEKICEKYFSPEEIAYIGNSNEKFLEIWVKKEAFIKFSGKGFRDIKKAKTLSASGFYTDFSDEENIIFTFSEKKIKNFKIIRNF